MVGNGIRIWVLVIRVVWLIFVYSTITISATDSNLHYDHTSGTRKLASFIPGFISINCGAASDGMDDAGIYYQTDEGFIDSGVNTKISSELITSGLNLELRTLRYFPTGQKNCYTLKPDLHQKGTTSSTSFLIRAVFMYGNYDGANLPPKFELLLGTNNWTTVDTSTTNGRLEKEIIYTPDNSTTTVDVCLVNINKGKPFMSALELRTITSSIYQMGGGALILDSRYNLGGPNNTVIRYSDDIYDRKWYWYGKGKDWIPMTPNFSIESHNMFNVYQVPAKVLGSAVKCSSSPINFSWVPQYPFYKYYIFFYFAEIEKLQDGKQRTLGIRVDDEDMIPFTLKYLQPFTVTNPNQPITGNRSHYFSISSMDTDLPPILNAFEIYHSKYFSLPATNPIDVDAIMKIKQTYKITGNWQGDPCIPVQYAWNGVKCNSEPSSRIISLNLSSRGLPGNIIGSFSNLKVLQSLDLSHNNLTGTVPESLGELPFLKLLNLTGNMLEGSVPKILMQKSKRGALILIFNGNDKLCLEGSCKEKSKKALVATASVLTLVLLSAVTILCVWKRKRHGEIYDKYNKEILWNSNTRHFKFSEVVSITDNFASLIGEGGFGKVYLGILKDGTQVAVKLLSSSSRQGLKEFQNEVKLLMGIHHRNLVSLIGYCKKGDKMALIYEYVVNGNLKNRLSADTIKTLTWTQRLQIAVDTARGLDYLQNGCKPPIVHRDLKTSNILLDANMQAKIADFGLSRAFTIGSGSCVNLTTDPKGTFGYLDPEYYNNKNLNGKSDVYSFGVVLLELITGCKPVLTQGLEQAIHIGQWVRPKFERKDIESIVDPRIQGTYNTFSAWRAIEIAMACIPSTANNRLDVCDVYHQLKECLDMEKADGKSQTIDSEETVSIDSTQHSAAEDSQLEEINVHSSS